MNVPHMRVKLVGGGHVDADRVDDFWRVAVYSPHEIVAGRLLRRAAKSDDLLDALVRCIVPDYPSRSPEPAEWRRAREIAGYLEARALETDEPPVGKSEGSSQDRKEVASGRAQV